MTLCKIALVSNKIWIKLYEGIKNTGISFADCPVGSSIVSCMCFPSDEEDRGCQIWFAQDNTCVAYGDTDSEIIA